MFVIVVGGEGGGGGGSCDIKLLCNCYSRKWAFISFLLKWAGIKNNNLPKITLYTWMKLN